MEINAEEYRYWYNRGWRYSHRETATLDYGDSICAPDAWYDGYHDWASMRDKWASAPNYVPREELTT